MRRAVREGALMKRMIAAIFFLSLINNIHAATDTASLKLQGKVEATTSITFGGGDSITHNVNILDGEKDRKLDKAIEESNSHTGYTVSVSSLNKGLKHEAKEINYAYKLIYGDKTIDITQSGQASQQILKTDASLKKERIERDVKISIPGDANAASGNYSDQLTLTIATNG